MAEETDVDLSLLAAGIVSSYVAHNKLSPNDLAQLIGSTYTALQAAGEPAAVEPQAPKPDKAAVRKSLTPDHIISFIDGRKYTSLKRHLTSRGMTPHEYRETYGLPKDYPMVSPGYSARRSELAKSLGLGRKRGEPKQMAEAEPEAKAEAKAPKAKRGGRAKSDTAAGEPTEE